MGVGKTISIQALLDRANRFFDRDLWDIDLAVLPTPRAVGVKITRVLSLAWQGWVQNDCPTRASALTYITVLSIVPLLACGFAVAKGFGAYQYLLQNTIEPFLDQLAPPIPPGQETANGAQQLRDVAESILGFVARTNFANLGLVGFAFLVFAALKLMTRVEGSFNVIWGVQRARSWLRKVTDFIALVVVTPVLLLAATAVTAALQNNVVTEYLKESWGAGALLGFLFRLLPLVTVWFGFCFLYMIMPNTRVPFLSALIGGVVGGTGWQVIQLLHVKFQVGVANYNAIYAGFAALPVFLVWVYMNWVVVQLGALLAWAHQAEPSYRERKRVQIATVADRQLVALRAVVAIGSSFRNGKGSAPVSEIAAVCNVPPGVLQSILAPVITGGLVATTDDADSPGYLPARPLTELTVADVLEALRGEPQEATRETDAVSRLLDDLRADLRHSDHNLTLAELVEARSAAPTAAQQV